MSNNLLDLTLLLEVLKAAAGERAVDLKTIDEGSDGDKAVGLDVLVELVGSGLVKDDGVLSLVLDCMCVSVNLTQDFCVVGGAITAATMTSTATVAKPLSICRK